jgi:hypothetical protein
VESPEPGMGGMPEDGLAGVATHDEGLFSPWWRKGDTQPHNTSAAADRCQPAGVFFVGIFRSKKNALWLLLEGGGGPDPQRR